MTLRPFRALLCSAICLLLSACQEAKPPAEAPTRLTIYAAASLAELIHALGDAFSVQTGAKLDYNFASSGSLARQLIAAERADLFISAHLQWMERVAQADTIRESDTQILFGNQLALIAHPKNPIQISQPSELCQASIQRLSIGDPSYVPAGRYAKEWLEQIECAGATTWQRLQPLTIPAIDAPAALATVKASRETIGLVYLTDYLAQPSGLRLLYSVPAQETPSILYYGAPTRATKQPEQARAFLDFILSEQGLQIIHQHGFLSAP